MTELSAEGRRKLERVLESAIEISGADSASVWLFEEGLVRPIAVKGERAEEVAREAGEGVPFSRLDPIGADEVPMAAVVSPLSAETKVAIADRLGLPNEEFERLVNRLRELDLGRALGIPIRLEGRVLGLLGVSSSDAHVFDDEAVSYLESLAWQIGVDLLSQAQEQEARARAAALESFNESTTLLAASLDIDEVLSRIADTAPRLVNATHGSVFLWDEGSGDLVGAAASHGHRGAVRAARIAGDCDSDLAKAVREREPVVTENVEEVPCTRPPGTCLACTLRMKAIVCLPLISAGEPLGVLLVSDRRRARPFPSEQLALLQTLAHQAAAAIRHARLHATLNHRERTLRVLSDELVQVHEDERRGIAREVHDVVVQGLAALALELGMAESAIAARSASEIRAHCRHAEALLADSQDAVQKLSDELRPRILDELGLGAAIRWHCNDVESRTGLKIDLDVPAEVHVPGRQATAIYRALQEALTNVVRHARARHVEVRLVARADGMELEVADDGRGFNAGKKRRRKHPGVGLLGMQERARHLGGTMRLETASGSGTRIRFALPSEVRP